MGIDVWEVIEAAKTKPFGFQAFYPGPGLGGHCIPIDPFYLTWAARQVRPEHALHRAGRRDQHGHAAVRRRARGRGAQRRRQGRSRAAGSACWASPTRRTWTIRASRRRSPILEMLQARGADRLLQRSARPGAAAHAAPPALRLDSQPLTPEFLAEQDCVLIVTDHSAYDCDLIVETRPAGRRYAQCHGGLRSGRRPHREGVTVTNTAVERRDVRSRETSMHCGFLPNCVSFSCSRDSLG